MKNYLTNLNNKLYSQKDSEKNFKNYLTKTIFQIYLKIFKFLNHC